MAITIKFKVWGLGEHRQRNSFAPSARHDFSEYGNIRILEEFNFDMTGSHDYSILVITRNNVEEVWNELKGQLLDGTFENCNFGHVQFHSFLKGEWVGIEPCYIYGEDISENEDLRDLLLIEGLFSHYSQIKDNKRYPFEKVDERLDKRAKAMQYSWSICKDLGSERIDHIMGVFERIVEFI